MAVASLMTQAMQPARNKREAQPIIAANMT